MPNSKTRRRDALEESDLPEKETVFNTMMERIRHASESLPAKMSILDSEGREQPIQVQLSDGRSAQVLVSASGSSWGGGIMEFDQGAESWKKWIYNDEPSTRSCLREQVEDLEGQKHLAWSPEGVVNHIYPSNPFLGASNGAIISKESLGQLHDCMEDGSYCRVRILGASLMSIEAISCDGSAIRRTYLVEGGQLSCIHAVQSPVQKKAKKTFAEGVPLAEQEISEIQAEIHGGLKPGEIAERMRVTRATVNNQRKACRILGLPQANRYVYPAWQLSEGGQPLAGVSEVLEALFGLCDSPLDVLDMIISKRSFYSGLSIKDLLLAGRVDDAIAAARKSSGDL